MHGFGFATATSIRQALSLAAPGSAYLAGGTTLVDLMKLEVMTPGQVIDINRLPMRGIRWDTGGLHLGALERMSEVALDAEVGRRYPVLTQALSQSASPQLRNMASIGGNVLQRTRCDYFRDVRTGCNKRSPGSGCPARSGENRTHAILGTSQACVATHPSDLAVALVALDAVAHLQSKDGDRLVKLDEFYRVPGDTPAVENQLRPGELITEIVVPPLAWARRSAYVKVRDRTSYEFALTSAAVALDVRDNVVRDARIAVGGVGTKPWRLTSVEAALRGQPTTEASYEKAARLAVDGATPLAQNAFKIPLLQKTIVRALAGLR